MEIEDGKKLYLFLQGLTIAKTIQSCYTGKCFMALNIFSKEIGHLL